MLQKELKTTTSLKEQCLKHTKN